MSRARSRRAAAAGQSFKGDESGSFRWTLFEGVKRRCRECGREPLLIRDVGEHRTEYPKNVTTFLCVNCQRKKVDMLIEETRASGSKARQAPEGP